MIDWWRKWRCEHRWSLPDTEVETRSGGDGEIFLRTVVYRDCALCGKQQIMFQGEEKVPS